MILSIEITNVFITFTVVTYLEILFMLNIASDVVIIKPAVRILNVLMKKHINYRNAVV